MQEFISINPFTEEENQRYPFLSDSAVDLLLDKSYSEWREWKKTSFDQRATVLEEVASALITRKTEGAILLAEEMGKPVTQGEIEIEKCALLCRYYAEHGKAQLTDIHIKTEAQKSFVSHQPLGPLFGIMPWNYPYWQVFRFVIPTIFSGNVVSIKHAPNVPRCALFLESIFQNISLHPNLVSFPFVDHKQSAKIIADQRIRGISFTGSVEGGCAIATIAGKSLKPCVLELGGSDPFLVFEDANFENALETAVASRTNNAGQVCIAAKRFIVQKTILEEFTERFAALMSEITYGDPLNRETKMGPMARKDLRDKLHQQVSQSVAQGVKIVIGGERPDSKGFFYPATVLTEINKEMDIWNEELFGPVAMVVPFEDESEAIRLANDSQFGLGASIFSENIERAKRVAKSLDVGSVFVNSKVSSDPRLPFGGVKNSGYGRELGEEGLKSFCNLKTTWIS